MITTGVVKQINQNSTNHTGNKYLVDISLFRRPDSDETQSEQLANCCILGGFYSSYNVGDLVYISFINDDLSKPVILGKIYQGIDLSAAPRGYGNIDALKVATSVELPQNLKIGEMYFSNVLGRITELEQQITQYNYQLELRSENVTGIASFSFGKFQSDVSEKTIISKLFSQYPPPGNNVPILVKDDTTQEFIVNSILKICSESLLKLLNPSTKLFENVIGIKILNINPV